ncbi:MAG: pantetheine-phosphate adenylyltransferase [Lentilactobacillus diolivorans]|jgi:pantetheine-phosphate adenylyltransferase|nr:pantetheine-phosphate adenylyltransferase [Lentilactobacillus diolivorans]RRG01764.1 MAG: pantetheine-phosphate adenylyltransferase [Lactobacillus sp.]
MTSGLYAGSFDPITLGHVDVIRRASRIFDRVIVAISINTSKHALFSIKERTRFAKEALQAFKNVTVISSHELTVNLAEQMGADVLIRGVRGSSDIDSELAIAGLNEQLDARIQTIFIPTAANYRDFSSSMIKEIAKFHGDVSHFVPEQVAIALQSKFQ